MIIPLVDKSPIGLGCPWFFSVRSVQSAIICGRDNCPGILTPRFFASPIIGETRLSFVEEFMVELASSHHSAHRVYSVCSLFEGILLVLEMVPVIVFI